MKKKDFILAVISAAAICGVMFISCKKEEGSTSKEGERVELLDSQNEAVVHRIVSFKEQVDARKSAAFGKSTETVSLEEAMNNVVDLFNVTYAEPMAYYTESERHGFTINVSLTSDGKVLLDDVVSVYEQAVSLSREAYHSSSLPNKDYRRLMVTSAPQRDGSVDLHFDGSYGSKGIVPPPPQIHHAGPFGPGDDWHFMDGMGSCDGTRPGGADKVLQDTIMAEVRSLWPADPNGYRGFYTGFEAHEFSPLSNYTGIFYSTDPDAICIEWQYMNDYLAGERRNIFQVVPQQFGINLNGNPMQQYRYFVTSVVIEGQGDIEAGPIFHWTEVEYARYNYIEIGTIERDEL